MSKAIAVGVVGLGISAAMLGLGFMAGKGGTAPADAPTGALLTAAPRWRRRRGRLQAAHR